MTVKASKLLTSYCLYEGVKFSPSRETSGAIKKIISPKQR
jgi:hypothetical protein